MFKHWLAGLVKHRLISVNFFMREVAAPYWGWSFSILGFFVYESSIYRSTWLHVVQRRYQELVCGANKQSYFHHDVPTDLLVTNKQYGCLCCSWQVASTRKIWCNGVCDMMSSTIIRSCMCLFSVPLYFYSGRKRDS